MELKSQNGCDDLKVFFDIEMKNMMAKLDESFKKYDSLSKTN